jgi:deoxyribonuclease V
MEKEKDLAHTWNVTPKEAIAIQHELRGKLSAESLRARGIDLVTKPPRFIAGADVSLNLYSTTIYAGIIVLSWPDLQIIDYSVFKGETKFPYIPGLLSFREIPALLECWNNLKTKPDIVMVDGHGIAHPRRLGIAAHFGVLADVPTLGCAKNILFGQYDMPATEAGTATEIIDPKSAENPVIGGTAGAEVIGYAFRSKKNVKPVFISPGHKMSLDEALAIAKASIRGYRLPEPTRQAHLLVNRFRLGEIS